jgi:hypothetical protein
MSVGVNTTGHAYTPMNSGGWRAESIEILTEGQAFSQSHDLDSPPPPPPLPSVSCLSFDVFLCVVGEVYTLLTREMGEGVGGGRAKSYDR